MVLGNRMRVRKVVKSLGLFWVVVGERVWGIYGERRRRKGVYFVCRLW